LLSLCRLLDNHFVHTGACVGTLQCDYTICYSSLPVNRHIGSITLSPDFAYPSSTGSPCQGARPPLSLLRPDIYQHDRDPWGCDLSADKSGHLTCSANKVAIFDFLPSAGSSSVWVGLISPASYGTLPSKKKSLPSSRVHRRCQDNLQHGHRIRRRKFRRGGSCKTVQALLESLIS
jgi:hypothetical protein